MSKIQEVDLQSQVWRTHPWGSTGTGKKPGKATAREMACGQEAKTTYHTVNLRDRISEALMGEHLLSLE